VISAIAPAMTGRGGAAPLGLSPRRFRAAPL